MAFMPFNSGPGGMQSGITRRFGWPGLSGQPSFAPIGPVFPQTTPSQPPGSIPPSMTGALSPNGGMAAVLGNDRGGGGNWGQSLGNTTAQRMMGGTDALRHVGGAGSGPGYFTGNTAGQSPQAPASMSQALNPDQAPEGYALHNGHLGIPYEGKRSAMANPLDFLGFMAGGIMPGGGMLVSAANEIGKWAQPDRFIDTLGIAQPGVDQNPTAMGALYGYAPPAAAPAVAKAKSAVSKGVSKGGGGNSGAGFGASHGAGGYGGKGGGTGGGWAGGGQKGGTGRGPK